MIDVKGIIGCLEQAIDKSVSGREKTVTFSMEATETLLLVLKMLNKQKYPTDESTDSAYSKIHDKTSNNAMVYVHWTQFKRGIIGYTEMLELLVLSLVNQNEELQKYLLDMTIKKPTRMIVVTGDNHEKAMKFLKDTEEIADSVMDRDPDKDGYDFNLREGH
jgi:hypothetical protein